MTRAQQLPGQLDLLDLMDGARPDAPAIYLHPEKTYGGLTELTSGRKCGFCRRKITTQVHTGESGGTLADGRLVSIWYCGRCCDTVMLHRSPLAMLNEGTARLVIEETRA